MKSLRRPLAGAAAAVLLGGATLAGAAPRAQNPLECGIAADMAVVARSLAAERIERAKADTIMARIYDVSGSERGRELMKQIVDAAYAVPAAAAGGTAQGSAQQFAENLYATCVKSGGDMDAVLGKRL
ncbi:MAG TPA: hypothetical protein VF211_05680 [Burkholderiales bacterium]